MCLRWREKILRQQQQQLSASTNVYCNNRFCIWSREMYRKCKQALFWLFSLSLSGQEETPTSHTSVPMSCFRLSQ
jgi:hypothetical protein